MNNTILKIFKAQHGDNLSVKDFDDFENKKSKLAE